MDDLLHEHEFERQLDQKMKQKLETAHQHRVFDQYFLAPFILGKFKKILDRYGTLTPDAVNSSAYAITEKIVRKNKDVLKTYTPYQFRQLIGTFLQQDYFGIVSEETQHENAIFKQYFTEPFWKGDFQAIIEDIGTLTDSDAELSAYAIAKTILTTNKPLLATYSLYHLKNLISRYFDTEQVAIAPRGKKIWRNLLAIYTQIPPKSLSKF